MSKRHFPCYYSYFYESRFFIEIISSRQERLYCHVFQCCSFFIHAVSVSWPLVSKWTVRHRRHSLLTAACKKRMYCHVSQSIHTWFFFRPLSFCELTTRFSVDVSGTEGKDYLPQLVSVLVVALGSTVLLYISFKHYTKKTLNRHMEDEEEQQRLLELK